MLYFGKLQCSLQKKIFHMKYIFQIYFKIYNLPYFFKLPWLQASEAKVQYIKIPLLSL